jgi:hypothetical protein
VEFDTPEVCPLVFRDDANLVLFFISWAYSVRFGGMHELAQAALHLQRRHKVDLRPLLTYADSEVEDPDDQFALDHAWQDAAALASSCRATADAIDSDDATLRGFLEGYQDLAARLRDLATLCDWGAARGAPVRLTFTLA